MPNPRRFINRALVQRGAREERSRRMASLAQTTWGQAWLATLRSADQQNRLGRGMELARQGAVQALHFGESGMITAEVMGSQSFAYRVEVTLVPFGKTQGDLIALEVARRPEWLDLLLNAQLPAGIQQVLSQRGIDLFPALAYMRMHCNCPDAAVPCKHLAATLYQLAADIDEDPTLLFTMRGLDLSKQLKSTSEADGLAPITLASLRETRHDMLVTATGFEDRQQPGLAPLPNLLPHWPLLLPARPPFFKGGNLAELYSSYLRAAANFWSTGDEDETVLPNTVASDYSILPWQADAIHLYLDAAGTFLHAAVLNTHGERQHTFTKEVPLLGYLEHLVGPNGAASPAARGVVARAFRLARQLVTKGAVVPQLLSLGDDDYRIRWLPATQDATVADAVRQLAQHPGLAGAVTYLVGPQEDQPEAGANPRPAAPESEAAYLARLGREVADAVAEGLAQPAHPPNAKRPKASEATLEKPAPNKERSDHPQSPLPADASNALLAALLRPMLLPGAEQVLAQAEHAAIRLLFLGRPVNLANTGDSQLALALQLWLRRLSLDTASHRLLLQIDELDGAPGRYALRPLLVLEAADAPEPVSLPEVMTGGLGELLRLQVLRDMALLAEGFAPLATFVDVPRGVPEYIELYGADFAKFLFEVAPALRLVGAQVLLPHGLEQAARPRLSAVVVAGPADSSSQNSNPRPKGMLGLNSLIAFDWRVAVGNELIDADEFADLTDKYEGIVRLRDGFVWLEPLATARLLQRLANPPKPSAAVTLQSVLLGSFQGAPLLLAEEVRRLRENLLHPPITEALVIPGLQAELRPYQQVGVEWLLRNAEAGLGSLLADDMGLGKTLQTIALLEHYRIQGRWAEAPVLIVLPTSLITNWQRELARFAPQLNVAIYHGPGRKLASAPHAQNAPSAPHLILTSYGVVRSDVEKLVKCNWGALIIDEAQQIKNPSAAQTEAVKRLNAPIKIALSGTPVENRLSEYWSVFDFANPGYLGPLEQFKCVYANPIERDRDLAILEAFRQVTAPFILRRLKIDPTVIADLPDKITQIEPCHLEPEQAALYQQVVETQLRELATADETMRRARMLKFMTAVKQVCNHPFHYLKRGSKAIEASGKAQRLVELVEAALENQERVLVFTQYRQMGDLLAEMLQSRLGYRPPFLHGGLRRDERDAMVVGMQDGSGPPILLLSIKAGGTGLNLTAANHVIHYDLWWNPAVESQATDRAFRIGQARNVHVHRLITAGTFEERIDDMLSQKRELAELTVGGGGGWLGEIDLRALL